MRFVKNADLRPHERPSQWSFCRQCYGNTLNGDGDTTQADGAVCERCDGSGIVWIVDEPASTERTEP